MSTLAIVAIIVGALLLLALVGVALYQHAGGRRKSSAPEKDDRDWNNNRSFEESTDGWKRSVERAEGSEPVVQPTRSRRDPGVIASDPYPVYQQQYPYPSYDPALSLIETELVLDAMDDDDNGDQQVNQSQDAAPAQPDSDGDGLPDVSDPQPDTAYLDPTPSPDTGGGDADYNADDLGSSSDPSPSYDPGPSYDTGSSYDSGSSYGGGGYDSGSSGGGYDSGSSGGGYDSGGGSFDSGGGGF